MELFQRIFGRRRGETVDDELANWMVASAANEATGEVALYRIRKARPARPEIDAYRFAVSVTWEYDSPDGLPSPELKAQLDELDRALDPLGCDNGYAELAMVATGLGAREWLFYTVDLERFRRAYHDATARGWDWAVVVEEVEDPAWTRWRDVVDRLVSRGTKTLSS